MNHFKSAIQANQTFYLMLLMLFFTAVALDYRIGLVVLVGILICLLVPIYKMKNDQFDYLAALINKNSAWEQKQVVLQKQAQKAAAEAEKQAQEAKILQEKQAETARLIQEQELKQAREERHQAAMKKAMILHTQMKNDYAEGTPIPTVEEIAANLEQTEPALNTRINQTPGVNSRVQQQTKFDTNYQRETVAHPTVPQVEPVDEFSVQKHGNWINYILLFMGTAPIMLVVTALFGLDNLNGGMMLTLFLVCVIASSIYYLPTLVYHASTSGKIMMWILNTVVSWTFLGWIVLILIATSRNKNAEMQQQNLYYLKKMSDRR